MMHARQFGMDPAVNGMALGFYEESRNGLRIIGHGGDLNYFHSDMHLIPEKDLGFFVSYNSSGKGEMDTRTALWQQFLDRYFPIAVPAAPEVANSDVNSLTGKYLSSRRARPQSCGRSGGYWRKPLYRKMRMGPLKLTA